jgi:hypothetical protein
MTEPAIVNLSEQENDAVALFLIQRTVKQYRAYVFAEGDRTSTHLIIDWWPWRDRPRDPQVDETAPADKIIALQNVPSSELAGEERMYLDERDVGFRYARLSPAHATGLGMIEPDPAAVYKVRSAWTDKAYTTLTDKVILRNEMAERAYVRADGHNFLREQGGLCNLLIELLLGKALQDRSSNSADLSLDPYTLIATWHRSSLAFSFALLTLTAIYGGVHLAAWQFESASHAEQWLWRSSCIYIALYAVPVILIGLLLKYEVVYFDEFHWQPPSLSKRRMPRRRKWDDRCSCVFCRPKKYAVLMFWHLDRSLTWLHVVLCTVGLAAYIFARIFLVVESFISLRHVPIGVYAAVPWANYIPHF